MSSIYQEIILDHYQHPHNYGRIGKPDRSITVSNPLCGDELTMDVVVKGKKVKQLRFVGKGCAISKAAASLLTDYAKNRTNDELRKIDSSFIIKMLGVELGPNRLKCALLPLEALQMLLSN